MQVLPLITLGLILIQLALKWNMKQNIGSTMQSEQ